MENLLNTKNLPWAVLAAGVLGFILELLLSSFGGSFLYALLWVLTGLTAALLVWGTRDLKQAPKYSFNFPASPFGAAGAAAAAAGILICCITKLNSASDVLSLLDIVLGVGAAAALVFLSRCRWKGLHPSIVFHAVICVYLMVDLICVYRLRSSDPQVWKYCFSVLASVAIMLSCYYDAAFAANAGNRKMHTLSHLSAVYLCLLSLPMGGNPVFYLTMAAWAFTNLCSLIPMPRETR